MSRGLGNRGFIQEKEAAYREIFRPELQLLSGLPDFLDELDQYQIPYGIGTAAPGENADFVVDELDIRHRFQAIVHAGHVSRGKPDPQVFELVAEQMGLPLRDCLIFEDSPTGAEAAERAGAAAIILTTTHEESEFAHFSNVVKTIRDFTEIRREAREEILFLS